ncbi:Mut7-C RNAse domain-containing protein [Frateuria defendens]|uniref:Mut7-C RNAse domain-containing protein n=1 Tax=Frateuria defendens TaxID=2219559 RepID=UPI00066FFD1B|nr:Mut7-C RNAse domain-containing protein [Frateuria defendens]
MEPRPPPEAVRLCCDRMLAGLARWLRAAGYDTTVAAADETDRAIAERCCEARRVLLTCDRHLAAHPPAGLDVRRLIVNDADAQALQLAQALGIDWTLAPFTRCLLDNTPLREASADERAGMPPLARELQGPYRACPACGRVYWPGSHVRRMARRLAQWREQAAHEHDPVRHRQPMR